MQGNRLVVHTADTYRSRNMLNLVTSHPYEITTSFKIQGDRGHGLFFIKHTFSTLLEDKRLSITYIAAVKYRYT
jgi:hypothetical protein